MDKFSELKVRIPADKKSRESVAAGFVTDNNSGGYFVIECQECGAIYPSQQADGGGQIADTGDYNDAICPHCGEEGSEECENVGLAWNAQQAKIIALLAELEEAKAENSLFRETGDYLIQAAYCAQQRAEVAEKRLPVLEQDKLQLNEIINSEANRADAAEKRLATPVRLPDTLDGIGENLRTQDNRITSEPMFCVYQKREIVAGAEYDHDRIVWVDEDGLEANERQRMRLELLHDNCREVPEKWRRVAVKEIDEFVTCCFTEKGCKDYLACNGHNLRLPFIYVKSGFRNAEYISLRKWLMTFTVEGDE